MRKIIIPAFLAVLLYSPAWAATVSTLEDRTGVELTVYNVDLGLVKDQRDIKLGEGEQELKFEGVASAIIPESVSIKSVADPASLRVLEQHYEYDLLSPQKLMDKYVGQEVELVYKNPHTDLKETTSATILSTNNGTVLKIGDVITFGYEGQIVFPNVPENLIARPTLVWLVDNKSKGPQKVEAAYLTRSIKWRADYVLTLSEDDKTADLNGWVTIENRSGAAYKDVTLKLVAGEVQRVEEAAPAAVKMTVAARDVSAERFAEETFFEYHLYTLDRKTTVMDNQTKQISLLAAAGVGVRKEFVLRSEQYYYQGRAGEFQQTVGVYVEIKNSKENGLGMPLPKGIVRLYKRDSDGGLKFIGEDRVEHTPKDEKLRLKVGETFDLVAERKQTDWQPVIRERGRDTYEAAYEIKLRNHKEEDAVVRVIEPIPGDWRVLESSHKYEKTEAHTAEFLIPVPRGGEAVLAYRVRVRQ